MKKTWKNQVIAKLGKESPLFKSKDEAIASLSAELTNLAKSKKLSVKSLLLEAEYSVENNGDLDRAIKLSSLIYALKNS